MESFAIAGKAKEVFDIIKLKAEQEEKQEVNKIHDLFLRQLELEMELTKVKRELAEELKKQREGGG